MTWLILSFSIQDEWCRRSFGWLFCRGTRSLTVTQNGVGLVSVVVILSMSRTDQNRRHVSVTCPLLFSNLPRRLWRYVFNRCLWVFLFQNGTHPKSRSFITLLLSFFLFRRLRLNTDSSYFYRVGVWFSFTLLVFHDPPNTWVYWVFIGYFIERTPFVKALLLSLTRPIFETLI